MTFAGRPFTVVGVLEKRKGGFMGENEDDNVLLLPYRTGRIVAPTTSDWMLLVIRARSGQIAAALDLEAYSEALYPLHHFGWSDLRSWRSGRYKVIDAPRPELYDLDKDPHEATNLYAERRTLADGMLDRLRAPADLMGVQLGDQSPAFPGGQGTYQTSHAVRREMRICRQVSLDRFPLEN